MSPFISKELNQLTKKEHPIEILTNRELQIIKLAADSFTNKEIAAKLYIDEKTCIKHRENVYKKMNIVGKEQVRFFMRWFKENQKIHYL